ncbi:MAG: hypothetical protein AAFV71_26225 [Cyanobacteria bacterium J06633_8]
MFNKINIPIIVVSCDAYQDVWHPFFHLFFKNWSDCPFPLYLVSNTIEYPDSRVSPLLIGNDVDYSSNLIKALNQIEQEWLIFWVEDRPPSALVDTTQLVNLIELAQNKNAGYLNLLSCSPFALVNQKEQIGEIPKGFPYRVSMTVALWKKSTLLKILKAGETAWDIEKKGGVERCNQIDDKFYALSITFKSRPPIVDTHLISKGQLMWKGVRLLKQEKIIHYVEKRSINSFWRYLYLEFHQFAWDTYDYIRWQIKKITNKSVKSIME